MPQRVFPTKNNLLNAKRTLRLARLGYDLMDRKRSILVREMMTLIDQAKSIQREIALIYARAYQALERANATIGFCGEPAKTIPVERGLTLDYRSVMGVELPTVRLEKRRPELYYGLDLTNTTLDEAYLLFEEVKVLTAQLAQVESNVYRLADAIKKTQKRTNALDKVIIPNLHSTIKGINDALEEKDREEFSRLKVIKWKKENGPGATR